MSKVITNLCNIIYPPNTHADIEATRGDFPGCKFVGQIKSETMSKYLKMLKQGFGEMWLMTSGASKRCLRNDLNTLCVVFSLVALAKSAVFVKKSNLQPARSQLM